MVEVEMGRPSQEVCQSKAVRLVLRIIGVIVIDTKADMQEITMAVVVDHLLVEVEAMTVQVVIAVEVEVFPNRRIRVAAVAAAAVEIAILHTMIMILDLFLAPVQGHHHPKK